MAKPVNFLTFCARMDKLDEKRFLEINANRKFRCGDKVRVEVSKKKTWMSHFETGFVGLLGPNYKQQFGGGKRDENQWTVIHPKYGEMSWYDTDDLTLIEAATLESELKVRRKLDRG